MARIIIIAYDCEFENRGNGFVSRTHMLLADPIERFEIEVGPSHVYKVANALAETRARLVEADPNRSFFVSAHVRHGDRQPNGFKTIRPLEYDHKTALAEAA